MLAKKVPSTGSLTHNVTSIALVIILLSFSLDINQTHGQQQLLKIDSEATLNLNTILKHQAKLAEECRQLETHRLSELKRLLDFEDANSRWLHLNEQEHLVRLPAVCLLLNGPPGGQQNSPGAKQTNQLRLDMVNWIFDPDELAKIYPASNHSSKIKQQHRQAREVSVQEGDDDTALNPELLSNVIYDLNTAKSAQTKQQGPPSDEELFLDQYGKLLEDERYKSALGPISKRVEGYLSPVILVPGLAGSRLQARFKKQQRVNILCQKQSDWQDVWLSLRWFLPVAIDCWIDNARLVYDAPSGFARQPPGVEARVPDFGSIESVRHLDLRSPKLTKYFDSIIERYLIMGYQADKNLFAAPYDFRLAPQQLEQDYFPALKQLIDQAHAANKKNNQKVTLVCHSMGCTNLLYFLRLQTPAWRQAKLRKLISISSPWGGSVKALKALLVGEQFGLPIIGESKIKNLARTFPSVAYLLPQLEVFQKSNQYQVDTQTGGPVLVQTPKRSYNVAQLEQLLDDTQMSLQWQWFQRTTQPLRPFEPLPDLQVDCLHSLNIPTPQTIIFRNETDFPDGDYSVTNGDGDGTVNHQSLLVCADWAAKLPGQVKHRIIENTSHIGMLSHKHVLDHITEDVVSIGSSHSIDSNSILVQSSHS